MNEDFMIQMFFPLPSYLRNYFFTSSSQLLKVRKGISVITSVTGWGGGLSLHLIGTKKMFAHHVANKDGRRGLISLPVLRLAGIQTLGVWVGRVWMTLCVIIMIDKDCVAMAMIKSQGSVKVVLSCN